MTVHVSPVAPSGTPGPPGRLRRAWAAAHAPVPGVRRWARIAACAVPLVVVPSSVWRVVVVVFDDGTAEKSGNLPAWLPLQVYVVLLSVFSELVAFIAVGLIAAWGEAVPRWVPLLGGRRVPTAAAAVPAALGALLLTVLWTAAFVADAAGVTLRGDPAPSDFPTAAGGWKAAVFYVCYLPLLLWGPLLAAVTVAYVRRRNRPGPAGPR
ncbi:hypothetical protein ACPCBX_20380 [Streptomyces tuirus]|uniref:Uncharacterized protein n=1 Tax=Streptomyces tuirus TaxID=68278 RepID=A0A7G1NCC4_9ACTN|nr:hypothetical protein [Streptomyces tuirus]BCL19416.1 hypothetical protein GCM10017668_12590 [Streptomyces tuirus]